MSALYELTEISSRLRSLELSFIANENFTMDKEKDSLLSDELSHKPFKALETKFLTHHENTKSI